MKLDRGSSELHDNKHLMTGPKGNTEFCFSETVNIEVEEVGVAPHPMIFHRKVYPVLILIVTSEDVCWSIRSVKFMNESFYNMRCLVMFLNK